MARLLAAAAPAPLWNSLEAALRHTLRSFATPSAEATALDGEQARIRQSSRHWLVG